MSFRAIHYFYINYISVIFQLSLLFLPSYTNLANELIGLELWAIEFDQHGTLDIDKLEKLSIKERMSRGRR